MAPGTAISFINQIHDLFNYLILNLNSPTAYVGFKLNSLD